jgi:hypothetical protein
VARGKYKRDKIVRTGTITLPPRVDSMVKKKIAQAEAELNREVRINFRWGTDQLKAVQHVAGLMGVPYQTYVKEALFRQVVEDLNKMAVAQRHSR